MRITFRCDPALIDELPRPVPAKAALPDWLRRMAPRTPSALHNGHAIRTLKQCPPFVDAMSHGFMILLPCDLHVSGERFRWDWPLPPLTLADHPRAPLSFHVPEQLAGSPLGREGRAALKFNSFWTIELEPGWSLMAVHPINREDLPFRTVSGVVDADRFTDIGINFPAVWTQPGFEGVLPRGTPVAQCYPVPREAPDLVCEPMSAEHRARYAALGREVLAAPGVYRRRFRSKRGG
jgi:hypothetical protein